MLSKLRYFENSRTASIEVSLLKVTEDDLKAIYGSSLRSIERVSGGTLGVSFLAELDGVKKFFKTTLNESIIYYLENEIRALQILYQERLQVKRLVSLDSKNNERLWIEIDALDQISDDIVPGRAITLMNAYLDQFASSGNPNFIDRLTTIDDILPQVTTAIDTLYNANLLDLNLINDIYYYIDHLKKILPQIPRVICHGDFGPKNIMKDKTDAVVIDWEDVFIGCVGYDYLYWLTFMKNQKYLKRENLGKFDFGIEYEISIILLVVILKSYISYRSGTWKNNSISFEYRLREVIGILN